MTNENEIAGLQGFNWFLGNDMRCNFCLPVNVVGLIVRQKQASLTVFKHFLRLSTIICDKIQAKQSYSTDSHRYSGI
jgi:hypothetical protein